MEALQSFRLQYKTAYTAYISFSITLNLSKASFENFKIIRGKQCTEFDISQYQTRIAGKCHKLCHNFEPMLWKCYHVTAQKMKFCLKDFFSI